MGDNLINDFIRNSVSAIVDIDVLLTLDKQSERHDEVPFPHFVERFGNQVIEVAFEKFQVVQVQLGGRN
jgi:hypothetical protein